MELSPGSRRAGMWLLALLPTLLVIAIRWNAGPGRDVEDYAHYILHARNIVEGRPYGDIGCINSRFADFRCSPQPPGTPLTLAALFFVVGEHPLTTALFMLAISLGFALVAGWSFARWDPLLGLGVTMLSLLTPNVIRFASHVQSDLPFALAAWATILVADNRGPWSRWRVAIVTLLAFATLSHRMLGVALVPALLAVAVARRKELGRRGFVPFCCLAGALLAAVVIRGVPELFIAYTANLALAQNIAPLQLGLSHALLYPFPWDLANNVYHVAGVLLTVLGAVLWAREGGWRTLGFWFGAAYFGALVVLPFMVSRYFWPLAPLVVFGMLRGTAWVASRVPRVRRLAAPSAIALGCAALIALGAAAHVLREPPAGWLAKDPETRDLFTALRSLADSQPVRPAFFKPRILTLETGLRSTAIFKAPPDSARAMFERLCITHVVVGSDNQRPAADQAMVNMIRAFPGDFVRVYDNPGYRVFRFLPVHCTQETRQPSLGPR